MDLERLVYAPKIAFCAAIAVVALVTLEFLAYFGFHERPAERNSFGYSPDASFSGNGEYVDITHSASRSFWSQRYTETKPQGSKRIMLIGDSAAHGRNLNDSVTEALRKKLGESCALPMEVWNLASPGYGSQRKKVVVEEALQFHPDLIIYHANVSTEYEDDREWMRYVEYHSWHPKHWVDQLPFLGRVKLSKLEQVNWKWLPEDVRAASEEAPLAVRIAAITSKADSQYWMPRMLVNLDRTVEEIQQAGVPLLILAHAKFDRANGRVGDSGLDKVITEHYASRKGITTLTNQEIFSSIPDASTLFSDNVHWTSEGTDLVAGALATSVRRIFKDEGGCL
jgi:hypothetical protein